jgi:hypothetical protein
MPWLLLCEIINIQAAVNSRDVTSGLWDSRPAGITAGSFVVHTFVIVALALPHVNSFPAKDPNPGSLLESLKIKD